MNRIIVDLTEFNTWSGHLTGVQRVVYGIARALKSKQSEVAFVRFNDKRKVFEAVTLDQFNTITQESKETIVAVDVATSDSQKVKRFAKAVYNRAPVWVRNKMTPERKEKILKYAKGFYRRIKSIKNRPNTQAVKIDVDQFHFKGDDVLISAGRAWDNDTYMDVLEQLRNDQSIKVAYVVYDLIPIYQQHTFGPGLTERFSRYLYRALKHADYLFPISESTRRDVVRYADEIGIFNLPAIKTIRLGDEISAPGKTPPAFVRRPNAFAVCVGTIEARKNHTEIYYAYKLAAERKIELPDLYIVGGSGWLTSDMMYFIEHDADVKDKITIIHNAVDQDLAWLYKNALFTVYPSQYEGWGLPVAESIAFGTPCITTTASSMPEIAPDYVDHVSPFDPAELLEKMVNYSDPRVSAKQRRYIEAHYKPYTWQQSVAAIVKLVS